MAIQTVDYLVCDVQRAATCTNVVGDSPRLAEESTSALRLVARRQGWIRIEDRLDVCPSCRPFVGR